LAYQTLCIAEHAEFAEDLKGLLCGLGGLGGERTADPELFVFLARLKP
jgi:hypothetical protein